jgi:PAS domain S-box-containing protein
MQHEYNFDFLFDNLPKGIVIQDKTGKIVKANAAAEALLGLTFDQMTGRTSIDPRWKTIREDGSDFPGEEHPAMVTLKTGLPTKNTLMGVFHPLKSDWVWINVDSFPEFKEDKTAADRVYTVFSDHTEKTKTEADLIKSNIELHEKTQSFEGLINSQTSYYVRTDIHGNYVFASKVYTETFGWIYDSASMIGHDILKSVMEYDHQKVKDTVALCFENPGKAFMTTVDKPSKDGSILSSLWEFISYINEQGQIEGIQCIGIDITEIIRAERALVLANEKYRSLIESSDSIIATFDLTGACTFINSVASNIIGKNPEEALDEGIRLQSLFPAEREEKILADFQYILESKVGINEDVEVEINGIKRYFKSSMQPIFDAKGTINSILLNATEITDLKNAELQIKISEDNYRKLFDESPQAVLIIQDGIFVDCNKASEEMLSASRDYVVGKSPNALSPEKQSNGEASVLLIKKYIKQVLETGSCSFDWIHIKECGEEFLAYINLYKSTYFGREAILVFWKDITVEMKNQRKINQLSQIVDQSPVSIIMTDLDGNIEYVNEATEYNIGFTKNELIGQNPRIWKSDKTDVNYYNEFWDTLLKGNTWRGEFENIRKDGSRITESSTAFPIFDEKGELTKLVAIQENITKRKKTEDELKLFKTIFESSVSSQVVTNPDGKIIYFNTNFSKLIDFDADTIRGSQFDQFINPLSHVNFNILRQRVLKTRNPASIELQQVTRNGDSVPVLMSMNCIVDEKENIEYLAISVVDISERKLIENEIFELNLSLEEKVKSRTEALEMANNQLKTFFEYSIDLLCIADQTGKFVKLSNSFGTTLGYQLDELLDQPYLNFVHPEDVDATISAMSSLNSQEAVFKFINRYRTKSGEYKYIEWYSSPVGEFVYAVARDVTESLEQNRKLIEARENAEQANAQKSRFLSRMSHELRTPMNSILGFAQLIEMTELTEMQESSVTHILRSGKHLLELINEVLDISRIESGGISLSIEPVNVSAVIREVRELLDPLAKKNSVAIELDTTMDSDCFIRSDQQRTKQIITNIISNAIKYNKPNGIVNISQHKRFTSEGKSVIQIRVRDTGVGIDQEDLKKLFEPFQRIHAENSDVEGTGLGLAVVKELLNVLNGKVTVESERGKGSTFIVEIPECEVAQMDKAELKNSLKNDNTNSSEKATYRILYIEDNPSNITLVKDIFALKLPNAELIVAMNGASGMELIRSAEPQLILLDLDLPDTHGSEILKDLRANPATANKPVIIVSADATKNQVKRLYELGANDYITKPFDVNTLLKSIDFHLQNIE